MKAQLCCHFDFDEAFSSFFNNLFFGSNLQLLSQRPCCKLNVFFSISAYFSSLKGVMCNLLKSAVACLPMLSKSDHPLLWPSIIDEQLSQMFYKWPSHQIPPTIKKRIPVPLVAPLIFSELFFHLVPHSFCTNMFSEVAAFSTGSFFWGTPPPLFRWPFYKLQFALLSKPEHP